MSRHAGRPSARAASALASPAKRAPAFSGSFNHDVCFATSELRIE
jgi:hypothetical protein